jgi:hypothetical protein
MLGFLVSSPILRGSGVAFVSIRSTRKTSFEMISDCDITKLIITVCKSKVEIIKGHVAKQSTSQGVRNLSLSTVQVHIAQRSAIAYCMTKKRTVSASSTRAFIPGTETISTMYSLMPLTVLSSRSDCLVSRAMVADNTQRMPSCSNRGYYLGETQPV